ncbi:MAG: transcriptional regulator, partial [Clostridiales bacterium]|nr:transcriptional regulator [Clostridiales bacterium]
CPFFNIDLYAYFDQQRIPTVFINGFYPDLSQPIYVVADDRAGGKLACQRLLQKGHRRIAGVFKNDDIQGHRRYAGYLQALTEAGLPVDDDHVLWYATETRDDLIASQAQRLLKGCTAVVCYNDEAAMQLLKHPASDGAEVISFDHSTFAQLSAKPFYSLANPKEDIGRLAAEKLLKLLEGQSVESAVLPWRMPEDLQS